MDKQFTRRGFMATTGAAAGALAGAETGPRSQAPEEKLRLALIGTGGRGNMHLLGGLADTPGIEIAAVCDVYEPHQRAGQHYGWASNAGISGGPILGAGPTPLQQQQLRAAPKPTAYYEHRQLLKKEAVDAVIIATPLDTHYQIILDALDAGKYVFCEKNMCHSIAQARTVVEKAHEKGLFVQVGHQRRYHPAYNAALSLAREEMLLGRITQMEMQWNHNGNRRRFVDDHYEMSPEERHSILAHSSNLEEHMNWRIHERKSLGQLSEFFSHQGDVANWFLGKLPSRIMGMGGIDYWRDGRTTEDSLGIVMEYVLRPGDLGFQAISQRSQYQNARAINSSYTVRAVYSSTATNAEEGAYERIRGDEGTLKLSEREGCWLNHEYHAFEMRMAIRAQAGGQPPVMLSRGYGKVPPLDLAPKQIVGPEMEQSAEALQFRDFVHQIRAGGKPRANEMCGLSSTIISELALRAIREGRTVEVDPALMEFPFDTPDWTA